MWTKSLKYRRSLAISGFLSLLAAGAASLTAANQAVSADNCCGGYHSHTCGQFSCDELGVTVYWLRTPEEEKQVASSLYNRYCIRCHGIDGRGVWDIPDVPDFTNAAWQASRSDGQLARLTLEGRGAVMPAFRGAVTLEEAWALGRYLRSFAATEHRAATPSLPAPTPVPAPKQ